jgi:hypothetical protein
MPYAAQAVMTLGLALAMIFSLWSIAINGSGSLAVAIGAMAMLLVVVFMRYSSSVLGNTFCLFGD